MSDRTAGFLLILLCVTVGQTPFTTSVTQDVYQAEEHSDITLTWLLPIRASTHTDSLYIDIVRSGRSIYLYDSERGTEVYPDECYKGRVHCDPELGRRGRVDCLFTDVRLNDTGSYRSILVIGTHSSYTTCDLNVTATSKQTVPDEPLQPESRGRVGLFVSLGVFTLSVLALSIRCWIF